MIPGELQFIHINCIENLLCDECLELKNRKLAYMYQCKKKLVSLKCGVRAIYQTQKTAQITFART